MRRFRFATLMVAVALPATAALAAPSVFGAPATPSPAVKLKDAKLNIEHNATDKDTGFQGFIDSEGWQRLDVAGPTARCWRSRAAAHSPSSG